MLERLWLDVPYAEKDAAKSAGALWDPDVRRWYAPQVALLPELARWESRISELLPGEDRSFGRGLFVDLVPSTCWFTNVRIVSTKASGTRFGPWSTGGPVTGGRPAALRAAATTAPGGS